ncbi:MAG: SUMF1/EgtB/PvdO family nonheme iron enzyme [Planctomycetota bacterium]
MLLLNRPPRSRRNRAQHDHRAGSNVLAHERCPLRRFPHDGIAAKERHEARRSFRTRRRRDDNGRQCSEKAEECRTWEAETFHGECSSGWMWGTTSDCHEGPANGDRRVLRGGCWINFPAVCRSSNRAKVAPVSWSFHLGFRVVRVLDWKITRPRCARTQPILWDSATIIPRSLRQYP